MAGKYKKTKEVEALLNKLAGYMAGDIPIGELDKNTTSHDDQKPALEATP